MAMSVWSVAVMAACIVLATGAAAQSAGDIRGASPLVVIENEPPPRLIVDPPLAQPPSRGMGDDDCTAASFASAAWAGRQWPPEAHGCRQARPSPRRAAWSA